MSWARIEHPRPHVEQWQRVLRWQQRLHAIVSEHYDDGDAVVDHALALLQNCFCMRDWLSRSLPSKETEIQNLFSSPSLRLCCDLANGSKHLAIDRPSVDARHSVHASYVPAPLDGSSPSSYELILAAGGDMIPFLDLCATCVQELQSFLVAENLLPANFAGACGWLLNSDTGGRGGRDAGISAKLAGSTSRAARRPAITPLAATAAPQAPTTERAKRYSKPSKT